MRTQKTPHVANGDPWRERRFGTCQAGVGEQAGWLVDWLAGGLVRSLSGWLVGWLAGGLADWLGGRRGNSLPMYAVNAMAHVRTLEQNSGC